MMEGHGGDCGGGHFVGDGSGGEGGYGIALKPHEVTPLMTGLTINGAPVVDQSHELVIERPAAEGKAK